MSLVSIQWFYSLAGVILFCVAFQVGKDQTHPKRWGTAAFWAILGLIFLGAKWMPDQLTGLLVIALVALAATGQVSSARKRTVDTDARTKSSQRYKNRLLIPPAMIALVAAIGAFLLPLIQWNGVTLIPEKQANQIALSLGCVVALLFALRMTRSRVNVALGEGGQLLQIFGWAVILPQMLAALGGVFAASGVGDVISEMTSAHLPSDHKVIVVVAYCAAMALFTIIMGNAFAAFPLITLGIGLPFIVVQHGGNPAIMGSLGMLSGYCGTLVTPMAANFNVVPAVLLELEDRNAIIKAQAPFAIAMWLFNVGAMAVLVYRF